MGLAGVPVVADAVWAMRIRPGRRASGPAGLQPDWAGGDAEGLWRSFIMVERVLPWIAVGDGRT
jgi:hypothetical protein